jgi:hypothetical protein
VAAEQTILLTVIPRGITFDAATLPVSVFVAPRLRGADKLGAFPDWLQWTQRLAQDGLTLRLRCGTRLLDVRVDQELHPELWEALFDERTLVHSHVFDDYSDRAVVSFPVRETLSALKSMYQEAAIELAQPDRPEERERTNRRILRGLLDGLAVHWNDDLGERLRQRLRDEQPRRRQARRRTGLRTTRELDGEGLIVGARGRTANQAVSLPFSVFHNMPTPKGATNGGEPQPVPKLDPDWDTTLDFHRVLSSLNSYPALLRALGLVLDFELPTSFVPPTPAGTVATLCVEELNAGWDWAVAPAVPALETACIHLQPPGGRRAFLTAPGILGGGAPSAAPAIVGLLDLDPRRFGLAQVDVDGGMHKAIILAETWHNPGTDRNLDPDVEPDPAPHPEIYDPEATLPALRSGGFSLFADDRALDLLDTAVQSKTFNEALESGGAQPRPFFAEDLVRGYRLDVWDSHTRKWHSLHRRSADYAIQDGPALPDPVQEESFIQLAAMQPAPGAEPESDDLYLHEAIARWAGWSLAVEMPGKHLSSNPDPDHALLPNDTHPDYRENEPVTPFKLTPTFGIVEGTLPRLRFGWSYRFRARAVDLAGSGLEHDDPAADSLALVFALPRDQEGFPYLRFEPVAAPIVVMRDESAVTGPGSSVDRLVIRTRNADVSEDEEPADLTGADRHVLPSRTSVELGERIGMFDAPTGELKSDAATWELIADRDAGELQHVEIVIAGKENEYPLEPGASVDPLPYLPDVLAHGAAIRDLPGSAAGAIGEGAPAGGAGRIEYEPLSDPNPRPGSATLIPFGAADADWQGLLGFRLALAEPAPEATDLRPSWDPVDRVLTVFLPKGTTATVPLSSYLRPDDLKLMGQWQWLRELVERITTHDPERQTLVPGGDADRIAHALQQAVEGGHWLLTPPRLLTLVHAVQQPLGRPAFTPLDVEHDPHLGSDPYPLQTKPGSGRPDPTELAAITAWRRPGATDAFLMGGLRLHGASTDKVDLLARWTDPVDDPQEQAPSSIEHEAHADEVPLRSLTEDYLIASGPDRRPVGYYDPEHDQIAFVRSGDWTGPPNRDEIVFENAAPRHLLEDTKHHRVTYTAVATSRFREYFPQDGDLEFTRESEPVVVDVPASARPLAPGVVYVVPTFGWQRQTETNLMRSVRFGGGLRIYLERGWYSSGEGELLGVTLWTGDDPLDEELRNQLKGSITQWGMDPIWQTANLFAAPLIHNFPDTVAFDRRVPLEESTAGDAGFVNVVGFHPEFDEERKLWFADLTVDTGSPTYMPFVRLALVRYQPDALLDAKISRVVLADFAQLTPDRSATVTCDPYHPRTLRVAVSGVAPRGPQPSPGMAPTQIRVRVQERGEEVSTDLGWRDTAPETATVTGTQGPVEFRPDLVLWSGTVAFAATPEPGRFRLLVEERELVPAGEPFDEAGGRRPAGRLIYAETFELDAGLLPRD